MTPTVQDLHDLLSTLESDDDDERARILRRAQRATQGVSATTDLSAALAGQELGSVLSREAVSHVRSWLKARVERVPTPAVQLVRQPSPTKRTPPPYLPTRGRDRPWRKARW